MNDELSKLINAYQAAVRESIALLERAGISRPATSMAWVENDMPHLGELPGGVRYLKHGYGCAVHLPLGKVDFDFGINGQIDGFDLWRLTSFAEGRLREFGFSSEQEIKTAFQSSVDSGEIVPSKYLLHYLAQHAV
ncbi:MAG: hypothetical protein ABL931_12030 [Usitatibacteraceae bacterium]